MRSRENIWDESIEFLLKEYEACWPPLIDTYERNESWFKFYIILVSSIIGVISIIFQVSQPNEYIWKTFIVLLSILYLFGIATLRILYNNRIVIVEYINAINRIRKFFVERAKTVLPAFNYYLVLPHTTHKHFKGTSLNLLMIYMLFLLNFFTSLGLLFIYIEKFECTIRFGLDQWLSSTIFFLIINSFVINFCLTLWIFDQLHKRDNECLIKNF